MHVGTLIAYVRRDLGSIVKCCTVPTSGTWRYQRTSPPLKPGCYHSVWIFVADTMSMTKRVLYLARLRRVRAHLIWLDHRLVREPYREWAEVTAWALSLFLVCVADVHGLSDESGLRLGRPLGLSPAPPPRLGRGERSTERGRQARQRLDGRGQMGEALAWDRQGPTVEGKNWDRIRAPAPA